MHLVPEAPATPVVAAVSVNDLRERIRRKSRLKGRQPEDAAMADVAQLLGPRPAEGFRRDLLIEYLHRLNDHFGVLHDRHLVALANQMNLSMAEVYEVASFYSMFETQPVGRHHISVCTNISCMLCGGEELLAHVERRLGIKVGESTADGRFFLKKEEECLAACNGAPMMMVDHVYYENLTPEAVDRVLEAHK